MATAAAVGFSSIFMLAAPASAAPIACSNGAVLLTDGVCELRITTAGASVFTPTAEMSQLEVLLVAGGGSGSNTQQGYGAGGGGEVRVVGFDDVTTPIDIVVGGSDTGSSATQGSLVEAARPGLRSGANGGGSTIGGASGNGNLGFPATQSSGGGAGAAPTDQYTGGAGVSASAIAPAGSLFSNDTTCYGGGGSTGVNGGTIGAATCGAGYVVQGASDVDPVAATPNRGGGGSAGGASSAFREGGSGIAVVRWLAGDITVTFESNGRGGAVAPQTFAAGSAATEPDAPTAAGFVFNGWYTDAALTTRVDFSAPVFVSATYYASWTATAVPAAAPTATTPRLAATGGSIDPSAAGLALTVLGAGLALVALGARRTRRAR